jgi:hypothetical protein
MDIWTIAGTWFGALATAAAVAYALFRDVLQQPKLHVSFDSETGVRVQLRTVGVPDHLQSAWLRVSVTNVNSRTAAKNCRAYLVEIVDHGFAPQLAPDGVDVLPDDVRQLQWMHDIEAIGQSRDLLPGVRHWVDVLKFVEGSIPALCIYPPASLGSPGHYILGIQVSAENASPVHIRLRVTWDGRLESLRSEVIGGCGRKVTSRAAVAIASDTWRDHRVGTRRDA